MTVYVFFSFVSTHSTAASPTFSSRTSSRTLMTRPSLSSPSSLTGGNAAACLGVSGFHRSFYLHFISIRVVKAGAELTWSYSAHIPAPAASEQKQEVPCLCQSDDCQGWLHIQENLCDVCDTEGVVTMENTWVVMVISVSKYLSEYFSLKFCNKIFSKNKICDLFSFNFIFVAVHYFYFKTSV